MLSADVGCALLLWSFVAAASQGAEQGNCFSLQAVSGNLYRVAVRVSEYDMAGSRIECSMPGAFFSGGQAFPEYGVVVEAPGGRSAWIEDPEYETVEHAFVADSEPTEVVDQPLTVQLARMRGRIFLRVAVRPFVQVPETGRLRVYRRIEGFIRVSEDPPQSRASSARIIRSGASSAPFCDDCPARMPVGVSGGSGAPGDYVPRRSVTNDVAWQVRITDSGLYRITGDALAAAGMPAAWRDASRLRISVRDQTVPVWRSTIGVMQSNDWILFYGAAVDATYATQNVYWLSVSEPSPEPDNEFAPAPIEWPTMTAAWTRVSYNPKRFYVASYNPLDDSHDHWFAQSVYGGTTSNFPFATSYPVRTGNVYLVYSLYGVNQYSPVNPDHRSKIWVGGTLAATHEYDGQVHVQGTASVPATAVSSGVTQVAVSQEIPSGVPVGDFSTAYAQALHLHYQRALVVTSTPFFFCGGMTQAAIRLTGLTTTNLWLLDVTDPAHPIQLIGYSVQSNAGAWSLSFGDSVGGARCFALVYTSGVRQAAVSQPVYFRNLSATNRQADYLVITPRDFREPVYRLLKHRFKNGWTVQVCTPDDIYNEFSYGVKDAAALRQYFGFAYHHYRAPRPGYVLLVGEGSYDPLNRLGHGRADHIPVRIGAAPYRRTALEQWFAMVDGDDALPDIKLGRIPAGTAAEVSNAVRKLMACETAATNAAWFESALLAADNADAVNNFKSFAETNSRIHLINGGFDPVFGIQTAYLDDVSQTVARQLMRAFLNAGGQIVFYMGHGSVEQWASENIWHRTDMETSTNTVFPVFTVFTCQSGAFHEPESTCLGKACIVAAGGGSACFVPTALSTQIYADRLADGFYESFAVDRVARLGDAVEAAFLRLWGFNPDARELFFYSILGDPALRLWGGASP